MHENDELQEFDLDDILSEFSEEPEETSEAEDTAETEDTTEAEEPLEAEAAESPVTDDTLVREPVVSREPEAGELPAQENTQATVRLEKLSDAVIPEQQEEPVAESAPSVDTEPAAAGAEESPDRRPRKALL